MTPLMVRRCALEIQQLRGSLRVEQRWLQTLPKSATRDELFRRVNYWRAVMKEAERILAGQPIQTPERVDGGDDVSAAVDDVASSRVTAREDTLCREE